MESYFTSENEVDPMRNYITDFLHEFGYPAESHEVILSAFDRILVDDNAHLRFESILAEYDSSCECDWDRIATRDCGYISENSSVHRFTCELVVYIALTRRCLDRFCAAGYTREMWHDAMLDLLYKTLHCHAMYGIWGYYSASTRWFGNFLEVKRFSFGRLQFNIGEFASCYDKCGRRLTKDSKVVHIHIPRTLTHLDPAECDISIEKAVSFFRPEFPDGEIPFSCNSWFFYSENDKILPENSNIRKFIARFDIAESTTNPVGDHHDMWRIFDMDYTGNADDLPGDSSLRRAYKQHIKNGGRTGSGIGVFFK